MKRLILFFFIAISATNALGQKQNTDSTATKNSEHMIVDAACGQCLLGLEGKDCDLAVRINGKAYFVDGTGIDDHGDAHAEDGFCNAIRKAKVKGSVVNNRFKATYFQLVADKKKEPKIE